MELQVLHMAQSKVMVSSFEDLKVLKGEYGLHILDKETLIFSVIPRRFRGQFRYFVLGFQVFLLLVLPLSVFPFHQCLVVQDCTYTFICTTQYTRKITFGCVPGALGYFLSSSCLFRFYPLMFYRWGSVQVDIQRVQNMQNKKHMINTLPLTSVITCDHCFSLSLISLILCFVTINQSFYFLLYMAENLFVLAKRTEEVNLL